MVSTLLVNSICRTSQKIQGPFINIIECEIKKNQTIDIPLFSDKTFTFLLLNTRSFPKHAIDISKDKRLYQADILCLTETHITPKQTTNMADQHLSQFQFLHNISEDKFQSLSVGYRDTVRIDF